MLELNESTWATATPDPSSVHGLSGAILRSRHLPVNRVKRESRIRFTSQVIQTKNATHRLISQEQGRILSNPETARNRWHTLHPYTTGTGPYPPHLQLPTSAARTPPSNLFRVRGLLRGCRAGRAWRAPPTHSSLHCFSPALAVANTMRVSAPRRWATRRHGRPGWAMAWLWPAAGPQLPRARVTHGAMGPAARGGASHHDNDTPASQCTKATKAHRGGPHHPRHPHPNLGPAQAASAPRVPAPTPSLPVPSRHLHPCRFFPPPTHPLPRLACSEQQSHISFAAQVT